MGVGSLRLFSPFGVPVRLHYSWWLIAIPVFFTLAHSVYPSRYPTLPEHDLWIMAALTTTLLFVSLLLHELGHAVAAQRFGIIVQSVELFILGGVARMVGFTRRPRDELILAGSGPLVSLIFGLLALAAYWLLRYPLGVTSPLLDVALWVAAANGAMLVFNLIPAYPLDGGRLLQGVLWQMTRKRALSAAVPAGIGWLLAAALIGWGAYEIVCSLGAETAKFDKVLVPGIWLILIGAFIAVAAYKSFHGVRLLERISAMSAAHALDARIQPVAADASFVSARLATFREPDIPAAPILDADGRATSMLTNNRPQETPESTTASQMAEPIDARLRVPDSTDLFETLMTMAKARGSWLVVEDAQGRYLGMITQSSLRAAFRGSSHKNR